MNKQKQEGKLVIEGRDDILYLATKIRDPPGRYLACPTTAKVDFAHPEYAEELKKKKRAPRKKKGSKDQEKEIAATLHQYTEFIARTLGVEVTADISPEKFLKEQLQQKVNIAKQLVSSSTKPSSSGSDRPVAKVR